MKKIAVFGKPGGGKSTLSKKLALSTGIKLYPLDSIEYQKNGKKVDSDTYENAHKRILSEDNWIIDGLGGIESFYIRLQTADTLIYIDLPYIVHYWWVTKRFFKGLFKTPQGWPDSCSITKGTIQSYKVLKICPNFWNDKLLERIEKLADGKLFYHIKSVSELNHFIESFEH